MEQVSIIVPAYNSEKYLHEMLDSVLAQTFGDWELILINDGSSDATKEIALSYREKDPRIRYYEQENQGQSAARNNGMKKASGKYIAFVDADDLLHTQYLEKLYQAAEAEQADVAVGGYEKFDDQTGAVTYSRLPSDWMETFHAGIRHVFIYSPWGKLIRRDLMERCGLSFSAGEQLEDGPFCCELFLLADKIACVEEIIYYYREYTSSTMGSVHKRGARPRPPYRAVEKVINDFHTYNTDPEKERVMEFCVIKILTGLVTNMYRHVHRDSRKELCAFCSRIMQTYFPDAARNPYIRPNALKKLPKEHILAVRMFVSANRCHALYAFSTAVSRFLRWRWHEKD